LHSSSVSAGDNEDLPTHAAPGWRVSGVVFAVESAVFGSQAEFALGFEPVEDVRTVPTVAFLVEFVRAAFDVAVRRFAPAEGLAVMLFGPGPRVS
tara:strand:+ start:2020 stop:2304 length:285 start_codon:yes stop_codon:yes gene_type:complete